MNDLSRNLLTAAREGMTPDAAAMARVRAKVAAATAGSTGAAVAIPVTKTGVSLGAKLAIVAVTLGVVATAVVVTRPSAPSSSPHISIAPPVTDETPRAVRVTSTDRLAASGSIAVPPARPRASPAATAAPRGAAAARDAAAPAVEPAHEAMSLAREVELIDQAMRLVRRGAAPAALDVVATYEREARGLGQMAEDAAAIALEAHCSLGHDVTARLAAFDRRWPSSAQRSRIHDACFTKR
jgi:hypothetical protein